MSSPRRIVARFAWASGTILACLTLAVPAHAGESPAVETMQPVEELVELDEVKVRGRIVANAVITMENRVFRLYNKLNEDARYDVHCRDARVRDSLSLLRICLPEFVSYSPPIVYPAYLGGLGYSMMSPCGRGTSGVDSNHNMYSMASCKPGGSFDAFYSAPAARTLVVAQPERIAEFKQHMTRVMNSDPELQAMAMELAGMYRQVKRVQAHYETLREERRAAQRARRAAVRERSGDSWPRHPRAP